MILQKFVIAIDGASGTGKSTVSKMLASEFGLAYIDTGAIYRSVALISKEQSVAFEDDEALKKLCLSMPLRFEFIEGRNHAFMDRRDVSEEIRTQEISMLASAVSALPVVRQSLLDMQRRLASETNKKGSVLDGRDIGTVVFPDAELKIFLTAKDETRARRRYDELKAKGQNVDFQKILEETIQRDKQDSSRAVAPLKKAADAVKIPTDDLSVEDVKSKIAELMTGRKLV